MFWWWIFTKINDFVAIFGITALQGGSDKSDNDRIEIEFIPELHLRYSDPKGQFLLDLIV
jgi:hypothetical protein